MHILITGGTGFIGQQLSHALAAKGHHLTILSRHIQISTPKTTYIQSLNTIPDTQIIDIIINLAGEPIADKRWTKTQKANIYNSRIETTNNLITLIKRLHHKPQQLISGSAIGYYGTQDATPRNENTIPTPGFTHTLCKDWESSANQAQDLGVKVAILRTGIVLGQGGGALKKMLLPFRLGLGGPIGHGQQYMSWVHIRDMVRLIVFILEKQHAGVFNATAPHPVTNAVFSQTLARCLHRPAYFKTPAFIMRLVFGEMAEKLLLEGANIIPARLTELGFVFEYASVEDALQDITSQ